MKVKQRYRLVDRETMVEQVLRRWAASVVIIAFGYFLSLNALAADMIDADADDDEQPIDLNVVRMKAEAGHVPSQTMLADALASSSDFTNAVIWYRKAAEKGSISAQLSLASLLITGRGTAKNPQEAAKWLRLAANGIETNRPIVQLGGAAPGVSTNRIAMPPTPIVITKASISTTSNSTMTVTQNLSTPPRIQRVTILQTPEPVLQDVRPTVRLPSDAR
jgi:hypothetical protein